MIIQSNPPFMGIVDQIVGTVRLRQRGEVKISEIAPRKIIEWQPLLLLGILLTAWFALPAYLIAADPGTAIVDQGIWLSIILSLIVFLLTIGLCIWLLHLFWKRLRLPKLSLLISHFKTMETWQQLGFYWALFGLLLQAATACLLAIC